MDSISFDVKGLPAPKGSVIRMKNGSYLPAGTKASRMNYDLWKGNIEAAARIAMDHRKLWTGAVSLMAEFRLPVPAAMKKEHKGWLPHTKRPDIDKLTRALLDPLTGIIWLDDSQVCHLSVNKVYQWEQDTGAVVVVDFWTEEYLKQYALSHQHIINVIDSL